MKILTAPSVFACDLLNIEKEVKRAEESGADILHYDIMDGVFVPNISIGFEILKMIRKITRLPIDAHMMTVKPGDYIDRLADSGADIVCVHNSIADTDGVLKILDDIHAHGMLAAIALKPAVEAEAALPFLDVADMFLVMTVEPGFSGQKFMDMTDKIRKLREYIGDRPVHIQVDGGINPEKAALCAEAGANVFVTGSSAFTSPDMKKTLEDIKTAAQRAYPI